jgi:hypothetical protein
MICRELNKFSIETRLIIEVLNYLRQNYYDLYRPVTVEELSSNKLDSIKQELFWSFFKKEESLNIFHNNTEMFVGYAPTIFLFIAPNIKNSKEDMIGVTRSEFLPLLLLNAPSCVVVNMMILAVEAASDGL